MSLLDAAQTIEVPDHEDLIAAPPRPWAMAPLPDLSAAAHVDETPDPAPRRKRSSSSTSARKSGKSGATAPQVAKSLAKTMRFSSAVLIDFWLHLEDEYIMTQKEAQDIAEPAARILVRQAQQDTALGRLIRRLLTFFSTAGEGYGDAIALLLALYAYGERVAPAVAAKMAQNAATHPTQRGGPRGPIPSSQPARPAGPAAAGAPGGFPSVAPGVSAFPVE